jgi:predicted nucleic acid-binding protein
MANLELQYWDSPLFISYLTGADEERVAVVRALISHLQEGMISVVVSTFAIAEVRQYRAEGAPGPAPGSEGSEQRSPLIAEHVKEIAELFDSELLDYRVLTQFVAQRAAEIGNEFPSLTPADCVHIATAESANVDVLMTYDGAHGTGRRKPRDMIRYDGKIGSPGLSIREAFDPWPKLGL